MQLMAPLLLLPLPPTTPALLPVLTITRSTAAWVVVVLSVE